MKKLPGREKAPDREGIHRLFDFTDRSLGGGRTGACGKDFLADPLLILFEILNKLSCQFLSFLIVLVFLFPSVPRIQYFIGNIGNGLGNMQSENRISRRFNIVEGAVQNRMDHCARVGDLHPVADAIRPACPTRVHQPAGNLVLGDFLTQHICIYRWMKRHERRAETSAENR